VAEVIRRAATTIWQIGGIFSRRVTAAQRWEETSRSGPAGRGRAPFLAVIGESRI
jgi:hypothetical protein